jgi:hypothetical protein
VLDVLLNEGETDAKIDVHTFGAEGFFSMGYDVFKKEAANSPETSVHIKLSTRRHIPGDRNIQKKKETVLLTSYKYL